jgi:hypothetical protein
MKKSGMGRQLNCSAAPGSPKFQGGNQKGVKVSGKIGAKTPMASSSYGSPKDKGVNR